MRLSPQISHGIALLYIQHLDKLERQRYERESDAQMLAYKEEFRKAKLAQDAAERTHPAEPFEIFEVCSCSRGCLLQALERHCQSLTVEVAPSSQANTRPRLKLQFPHLAPNDLDKRLRGEWEALGAEQREGYNFLSERDWDRCRGYTCLWVAEDRKVNDDGERVEPRKYAHFPPQYCGYCGHSLIGTLLKTCHSCGKTLDESVVAFSTRGTWVPKRRAGTDESQEVDVCND